MAFQHPIPDGVSVFVTAQPKSRRPGLGGAAAARLRIGAAAAPWNGRAACAAQAGALGLPATSVAAASGAASRRRRLRAAGGPAFPAPRPEAP